MMMLTRMSSLVRVKKVDQKEVRHLVLESGNKEGLLALHVSLHARKTLNRKPNVFNVIFLTLDLGKYINNSNLILT